jgi:arylsulfatase A-like enzyme
VTNNAPLRSGKGSLYEGGVRVPLMIRWPGVTPPRSDCGEPVILTDLFHTCMSAAGLKASPELTDGVDLTPLLKDPAARLDRHALYFHYPHYYQTTTPASAVIEGDWKLLEYFEDDHVELYNLHEDAEERLDLSKRMPEKAAGLVKKLHAWRDSVGANLPRPNPGYRSGK